VLPFSVRRAAQDAGVGLNERLTEILVQIVDVHDAQDPDDRSRLMHLSHFGGAGFIGWPEDGPAVTRDDLDELSEEGLIDIDLGGSSFTDYLVRPSAAGRRGVHRLRREQKREERAEPVDLSWLAVRPVLHAAVDVWTEAGAPTSGFLSIGQLAEDLDRKPDDLGLIRAVELLGAEDWLDVDYPDDEEDAILRPTMRAVVATKAWPGGDGEVAAERLLSALDEIAANAPDEDKRKWAQKAKDALTDFGVKAVVEVASRTAGI
jgi:hypothetical protein